MAGQRIIDPLINVAQSKSVCIGLDNCTIARHNLNEEYTEQWKWNITFHSHDSHASYTVGISRSIRDIVLNDINKILEHKMTVYLCISNPITTNGDYMSKLELYGYKLGDKYIQEGYEVLADNIDPENVIVQGGVIAKNITSSTPHTNTHIQTQPLSQKFNATVKDLQEIKVFHQAKQRSNDEVKFNRTKSIVDKTTGQIGDAKNNFDEVDWDSDFVEKD